jgi:hypothetical protein
MVPIRIGTPEESVYIDIHHVDFTEDGGPPGLVVSAIVGDGWYEGEIAVHLGGEVSVVFADQYLDEQGIAAFFKRFDRERLERAICGAVSSLVFSYGGSRGRKKVLAYRHEGCVLALSPMPQGHRWKKIKHTTNKAA